MTDVLLDAAALPSGWGTRRLRFLASINNAKLPESTASDRVLRYMDISSVRGDGSKREPQVVRFEDAPSRARRLARAGDTAISTIRTYLKAITYVDDDYSDCVWSTGFAIVSPGPMLDPRFLYYMGRAKWFVAEIQRRSIGVSYPAINADDIGDILCPVPPLEEQRRITEFLDTEIHYLDSSISRLQRLGALSQERMTAYRSFQLACGRLLRTGRDLPPSWTLTRLKFLARLQGGVTLGKDYGDAGLLERPYLRVANVQDGRLHLDEVRTVKVPARETASYELRAGDVLMTEGGDNDKLGRGTVWGSEIPDCLHQNHVFAVRVDPARLRPEFLAAVMGSTHGKAYFQSTAHQTTNLASTNSDKLMNLPVPLPPLGEQDRLLDELGKKGRLTKQLNQAASGCQAVLAERKDALVTAAITGQLDPSPPLTSAASS